MEKHNKFSYHILVVFTLLPLVLTSCQPNNMEDIQAFFKIKLDGKLSFYKRFDSGDGFQGNGASVEIYDIKAEYVDDIIHTCENNNFVVFNIDDSQIFDKVDVSDTPEILVYTKDGEGLYKGLWGDDEYKLLIINIKTNKLIYYHVLF